jgi:hypothetical protein
MSPTIRLPLAVGAALASLLTCACATPPVALVQSASGGVSGAKETGDTPASPAMQQHLVAAEPSILDRYFPMAAGTVFKVQGPLGYSGKGVVLARSPNQVSFCIDMSAHETLLVSLPPLSIRLDLQVLTCGTQASVDLAVGGSQVGDPVAGLTLRRDVLIIRPVLERSEPNLGEIRLSPDGRGGVSARLEVDGRLRGFSLTPTGESTLEVVEAASQPQELPPTITHAERAK